MSEETKAAGRCACGAVKLLALLPVKGCIHCHCRGCRQVHGAAFVTWFSIARERLQISGQEHIKWFKDTEYSRRGFCRECGTHMLYMTMRYPEDVHVTLACIFTPIDVFPSYHLSINQQVSWFPFEDSVPRVDEATIEADHQAEMDRKAEADRQAAVLGRDPGAGGCPQEENAAPDFPTPRRKRRRAAGIKNVAP